MSAFIRGDAVIIPILSRTIRVDNANDLRAQPLLCPSFSAILRILLLFIGKKKSAKKHLIKEANVKTGCNESKTRKLFKTTCATSTFLQGDIVRLKKCATSPPFQHTTMIHVIWTTAATFTRISL